MCQIRGILTDKTKPPPSTSILCPPSPCPCLHSGPQHFRSLLSPAPILLPLSPSRYQGDVFANVAMSPLYFKLLMELVTYRINPAHLKVHRSAVMRPLPASPAASGAQRPLGIDPTYMELLVGL